MLELSSPQPTNSFVSELEMVLRLGCLPPAPAAESPGAFTICPATPVTGLGGIQIAVGIYAGTETKAQDVQCG